MTVRQILHVDLDAFFVSVEQVLNPELVGKPVVVGGHADSRGVVACASYEARAFGLHAAMPIFTARRLCPQAIFLPGSFSLYRKYSAEFMSILADFSPDLEPGGLDEAWLDLTGFEPLYGPVRQTAQKIKDRVKSELGLVASIGIAPSKVVAKVASDFGKPDGLVEVLSGDERAFLAPLPLKDLPGAGPKLRAKLKSFGVTTIGQLAALPPDLLKGNFGSFGESLYRYANGIDDSSVKAAGPAKSISRETTLTQDCLDRKFLRSVLKRLAERVGADLRGHGWQAKCVTLKLKYFDFESITRSKTLKSATEVDQAIFDVGVELMSRALDHRSYPVRLIGIGVSHFTGPDRQLDMLDTSTERLSCLNKEIDRIRKKYGFGSIETGQTFLLNRSEGDL